MQVKMPGREMALCLVAPLAVLSPVSLVCHRSPQVLPARAARAAHDVRAVRGVDPGLQVSLEHPPHSSVAQMVASWVPKDGLGGHELFLTWITAFGVLPPGSESQEGSRDNP